MLSTVAYIRDNCHIQDFLLENSDFEIANSIYRLFMHHDLSIEYLLKKIFTNEFKKKNIYVFRESGRQMDVVLDFLQNYAGNFDTLSHKICELSKKENYSKIYETNSNKYLKKNKTIISKIIDVIDNQLYLAVTDVFIDFCEYICTFLNDFYSQQLKIDQGEKMLCSFIFFRIIGPKIIDAASESELTHISPLVKILNIIALGDEELFNEEHSRIKNIVARLFMKKKTSNYHYKLALSEDEYIEKFNILSSRLCGKLSLNIDNQIKHDDRKIENFIYHVGTLKSDTFEKDLKYFVLWTHDNVLNLANMEGLDLDFLRKWRIDGNAFIKLTDNALHDMGLHDKNKITNILRVVDIIKKISICYTHKLSKNIIAWSSFDLSVWLTLNNMTHLVELFINEKINSSKLSLMDHNTFYTIGIKDPIDIIKLSNLKKRMLNT